MHRILSQFFFKQICNIIAKSITYFNRFAYLVNLKLSESWNSLESIYCLLHSHYLRHFSTFYYNLIHFLTFEMSILFPIFLQSYQLYNISTKQLFFLFICINIIITHFFVDKVYNSVYNLFFCHF